MLRKALSDLRWTAFWFAVGGAGYTFLVSLFYPTFRGQTQTIAKLIATYPKGMLTAIGYTDMTTFAGFMGTESLNLFWPIIALVFATLAGAALVAKEVEDGTSEIWLSIPAARWRLLLGKMAALAIGLLGIVLACIAVLALSAAVVGATVSASGLAAMGVVMLAFLATVAAYSGLLSSLLSTRGVAAGISLGVTLVFYALWLVAGLADQWKQLKHVSIFTAYTPQKALETGSVDWLSVGVLLAITAVCVLAALASFQRRDAI
ncbi:MAG TPA: ABC transporter permease subunit [Candidatus Dormibacteraeota bacterium]|nr:ABC transporter permease subunit [Candidatus Dormibacteraeota bacterium]